MLCAQNRSINVTNTYINIPGSAGNASINFDTGSFTIEAWVMPSGFAAGTNNFDHTIIGNDSTLNGGAGYVLRTGGSRKLSFAFSDGSAWQEVTTQTNLLDTSVWQHVAVTKQAGNIKLFIDGRLAGSALLTTNITIMRSTKTLKIGENGSLDSRRFIGAIDEIKIWNTARSATDIRADMAELCVSYPTGLLAYYKLNDTGTLANNTIVCANDTVYNGNHAGSIISVPGAILYHGDATTLYVDSSNVTIGCGSHDGAGWATAFSDLSTAIEVAQNDPYIEKIFVARGTYYPRNFPYITQNTRRSYQVQSTYNPDRTFHIRAGLDVYGGFPSGGDTVAKPGVYRTILDGSKAGGVANDTACNVVVMTLPPGWTNVPDTTKLVGFTIRNGLRQSGAGLMFTNGKGAGIYCQKGYNVIRNCIITNVAGTAGVVNADTANIVFDHDTVVNNREGNISSEASDVTIQGCLIANNNAYGGLYSYFDNLHISGSEIGPNKSWGVYQTAGTNVMTQNRIHHNTNGGGVLIAYSQSAYIAENIIDSNESYAYGGGLSLQVGKYRLENNLINYNRSVYAGGVYCTTTTSYFTGNKIINNISNAEGGGVFCERGVDTFTSNIISDNYGQYGGGICVYNELGTMITNNFITNNFAGVSMGGLYLQYCSFVIANNVIARNSSTYMGGAGLWYVKNKSGKVFNNTFFANITLNWASARAGGLIAVDCGGVEIMNNIFSKNVLGNSDTIEGADFTLGYNSVPIFKNNSFQLNKSKYIGVGNAFSLYPDSNYYNNNPLFADTTALAGSDGIYGTMDDGLQLINGSVLIDTGNDGDIPVFLTTDIRNQPRKYGKHVDLGAYETGCLPANISAASKLDICAGNATVLLVNSASDSTTVNWYGDSLSTTVLDTGYSYITPVLNQTDTFWVAATGCSVGMRTPVKINVRPTSSGIQHVTACDSFFWVATNRYYKTTGIYKDTLTNVLGCDSVATLDLTVIDTIPAILKNGFILQADSGADAYQWFSCNPLIPIPNAISSVYTATANGSYAVAVTRNGCTDTSACVTVSGLGINNIGASPCIVVYPNPSTGKFVIKLPAGFTLTRWQVVNALGITVLSSDIVQSKVISVDLNDYPDGIYDLTFESNDGVLHSRLIKLAH